jgi:hypothetical protein
MSYHGDISSSEDSVGVAVVSAITSFDQALQSNLENADFYGHRCVARHRVGDVAGAISDCQQAAALYLEQGNNEKYSYALNMLDRLGGIA